MSSKKDDLTAIRQRLSDFQELANDLATDLQEIADDAEGDFAVALQMAIDALTDEDFSMGNVDGYLAEAIEALIESEPAESVEAVAPSEPAVD